MKFTKVSVEQTTAVTDIFLAVAAGGGVFYLRWAAWHTDQMWKLNIWSAAIGLIGSAAALGAAAHGLVVSQTIRNRIWRVLNMALALAVSLFVVGVVYDLQGFAASLYAMPIMLATGLGFYLVTLRFPEIFFIFIVYEVLALFFALGAYLFLAARGELEGAGLMATGILISIIAAGIQAKKSVTLVLVWQFDHNGIYHIVQVVGLVFLIYGIYRSMP